MNYYLNKLMTYHEVHKMYREGNSIRKISEHLGLNWRTVKKLLSKDDRSYQKELEQPISKKKLLDPLFCAVNFQKCHKVVVKVNF
jgi:uncharacterized protein YjcR